MDNNYRILFTGCNFSDEKIIELKEKGLEIVPAPKNLSESDLIKSLQDCDAVIVNGDEYYTEEVLSQCDRLKFIQFFGIGYQKCIDVEVAKKYGKVVLNTPKVNSYSVAEFTLGLICALNQKLLQNDEDTRKGGFNAREFFDLKDKTIGIVGMGHIGIHFANIMHNAFNCKILFNDIVEKIEYKDMDGYSQVALEELLRKSDIVSLHVPLNDSTRNLIGKKELELMKESAYLINTARAEVVDFNSLYEVLINNKIAGCAFDGFYQEPVDLKSNEAKLLDLSKGKFILTPHTGYNAIEGVNRVQNMCIENLIKVFNDELCKGIVTK